ncbi:GerMN domain-containing protein [Plantactinospora sp. WMMB782]|uniref:GerMN domain-containing protein n=1 Tax=Plantactinospora sp. WMMB782 TaxID=3404121 RepID=UPI003B92CE4F
MTGIRRQSPAAGARQHSTTAGTRQHSTTAGTRQHSTTAGTRQHSTTAGARWHSTTAGTRRRSAVAGIALLAILAGCGVRPTGVITGGPAPSVPDHGIGLFFVVEHRITLLLRPATPPGTVDDVLALLLAGPDRTEQEQGYRTEIPADTGLAAATTSDPSGTTVRLDTDVTALSAPAVDQIVCTVLYALPGAGPADRTDLVILSGPDGRRAPQGNPPECPGGLETARPAGPGA